MRLLLVEDDPGDAQWVREMLAAVDSPPVHVDRVTRLAGALQYLQMQAADAVLTDLSLPDAQGLEAVTHLCANAPQVPVVVLTGLDSQETAVAAARCGAQDYLVKGQCTGPQLVQALYCAVQRGRVQQALQRARDDLDRQVNQLQHEVEDRKQAEEELLRRNRELLALQTAIAATSASLDRQFVLDTVAWEMTNLLGVDGCAIYEWDQRAGTLSVAAEHPPAEQGPGGGPPLVYDLADYPSRRRVLLERTTQQVTFGQAGDLTPAERARMRAVGAGALLMIPMVFGDRVVGLLEISSRLAGRPFTSHEISLAHLLANQAASAIENANLYERAQREIARRIEAEEQTKASLREKEVLLKEIHHRVKNNLQVVSSLLYLQSETISDPHVLSMLEDSRNRVRSMALVHERLYQAGDLSRINFREYVGDLVGHLMSSYSAGADAVHIQVDADDVALDVDTAVPCGLLINELISNSLKHAFPRAGAGGGAAWDSMGGMGGEIRIGLHAEAGGRLRLVVADNGVGLPGDLDFRNTGSLGLLLVNSLVSQLHGTIELRNQGGTEFQILFEAPGL